LPTAAHDCFGLGAGASTDDYKVADAIAGSDYRQMSKGVVRRATAGLPRDAYSGRADLASA
jgi:hypothetical protein